MARAKSTKPPYINPTGRSGPADLLSVPPFVFNNVTTRAFPIKANLARLTQFCDDYLNLAPEIVQFRPSLPYVYLMVLNYGSMSSASVQARNIGWVSQHELTFTIPLERWCREGDRWVFKNWACVSPFIFVDDELSQTTGREVYGWPKIAGLVEANVPLWAADPRSPTQVFSLQIPVFPKLYAGAREELRDFIQIDRDPVPRFSELPPDPGNPWNPLSIVPLATRSWLGLMGVSLDMLLRSPARGYRESWDWATLRGMSRAAGRNISSMLPDISGYLPASAKELFAAADRTIDRLGHRGDSPDPKTPERRLSLETITLKQFRDTHSPDLACYQAIVSSPMGIDRINRLGLLGDYNLLRGDVSGGYTIRIHRYPVQPIVESLGLEVAAIEEGDDVPVAILKPTLPFWTDVDLRYGLGEVLCSRAQCFHHHGSCSEWKREGKTEAACPEPPVTTPCPHGEPQDDTPRHILYNTVQGGATQPIAGPFHFPDMTLQVYPLMADCSRLQVFLDEYLNQPLCPEGAVPVGMKFEPFGSYVYLMVSVQGGQIGVMWSEANNIGWWADKEVSFCVPVKWYRWKAEAGNLDGVAGRWELISLGMVSPFVFGNTGRAVITDREVNGRPTVKATIDSPADTWLTPSGPIAERRLLKLETEIFPALHLGQRAEQCTLLEIDEHDVMSSPYDSDDALWGAMLEHWGEKFVQELRRKTLIHEQLEHEVDDACALARELLCLAAPFNNLHLKQYRDAAEPDKACYQALVKTSRFITRLYDLREIEQRIHVRLHKYPGFPIAETLGLKVKHVDSKGGSVVQVLEPVRPFWMRLGLREHLGQVLCWRTEQRQWTPAHPWIPGSPQEAVPAEQPFFASPGRTGVVRGMASSPSKPLCTEAADQLHRALEDDLTAIQQTITSHAELRDALAAEADRSEYAADGATDATIGEVSESISSLPQDFLGASDSLRIREVLRLLIDQAGSATGEPANTHGAGQWLSAMPASELYPIAEQLLELLKEHGHKPDSGRLSRNDARRCIERIPEIQVVIETLLSKHAARSDTPGIHVHFIPQHSLPAEWACNKLTDTDGDVWTFRKPE